MLEDYKPFIDRVIDKYEGGYGWDKGDPGGPTKYGITCYDLAEHRHQKMDSKLRWAPIVRAMSRDEAETIYVEKYAKALRFNDLYPGVDTVILDYGINSGVGRPIAVAKRMLKTNGSTVSIDDDLLEEINKTDPQQFVHDICAERLHFMHQIRNGAAWREFHNGWLRRVSDLEIYSAALVHSDEAHKLPAPDLSHVPTPKATEVDADA